MKIILGGGVIGVATAYYLAKAGHAVTVVERQPGVALETSFANAGEVSPGYAAPWAGPGIPQKAVKWLLMKHGPLKIRPKADPYMWSWLVQMLRNCTSHRYAINKGRMVGIAEYSRDCLKALRDETGIQYDDRAQGTLQLFRTQAQVDHAADDIAVLKDYGVPFELLDAPGCIRAEPGLASVPEKIAGGLRLPGDETGDCHMFTKNLATLAAELGVKFLFDTSIDGFVTEGDRIDGVRTSAGLLKGDDYILALGSYSPFLARPLGIQIPVYPIKGYSITVPIVDAAKAPVSTVMDESYKVAITRLGDRIRVGGTAEVSGFDKVLRTARKATLDQSVGDLFPGAGDLARSSFWCGLRPMTPDGPPIIGGTKFRNLHLNTGHGTLGWTMACGSGRVLADLLSGRKPEPDVRELALSRYH
ncbi:D-amino acid dehydrogenase [Aliidongia dinghuensis]|uniref:D-amino acid dehydrogenase n=1 Tax=Aliidongia dinghuensis TaxID=1867774 RepID=A0A8J2YTS6_9PROT|nr:D-amino acid dehydrogenase [Aliidongia dinghuensis]GGF20797.1 D-amino acid dehydrogenase [Aliidongia dinghuensis]